jgi:DNA repair protein RecO (recombination protein O)
MSRAADDSGRVLLTQAVVLHRRAYRETSLLLDVCSADHGRLRLLAKGVKRGKSPLAHLLQPFVMLRLSWAGRGELPVLTAAEPAGPGLSLDGTALFCGFYINELLLNLLPSHDPHPEVFRLYLETLRQLGSEASQEKVLRYFEAALLEEVGYGLSLDREAQGREIDPAKLYAYVVDEGPVAAEAAAAADAIHGATLLGLKRRNLENPEALQEAKRLMRRVVHHYLNGRTLKSRELFRAYGGTANP